ncbi:MAG: protein kinase, partial [Polyangiaceae bacterium]|nr:protein kinase [Polyangiaceae bacterium]
MADSSRDETLLADSLTRAAGLELSSKVAGRFEILALIGAGGMGTVYKARDAELDEIVALKVLRRELVGSPAMVERFRQEVRLARRVTHRNVARAFDIGEHEGERFLTMEFVDGRSLADARDDRPMALARLVELGAALTAGLGAAHDAGVIHRDLKPDNILLARDGRVVITDFGIARATEGNPARTQGGVLVGTPAYMAPEQVEGREIDARADLFALGVILFELSTGRLPWGGDTPMAAAAARLVSPPRDARALGVGESLALLLDRCLARDPSQRPASAAEVASALRALPLDVPLAAERHEPAVARTQATPIAKPVARSKSVAVLPLRCAAGDDAYLAEGLAEDLVDLLSTTPGLRVKPRGAVSGSAGHDARAAGASLGVDVVVEGSLRRSGETLRVNVRVIDTASGFQLWAKRFDRPASEILQVSDEVAQATAAALTVEAPGAERAPADPRVLDLKLRARHEYQRFSAAGAGRAVELYTEASALAPDDATVAAALALAHVRMWFFGGEGSGQRAGEAAERALALAPE